MIRVTTKDDLKEITNLMLEGHDLHLKNRPDIFKGGKKDVENYVKSLLENGLSYKYVYLIDSNIVGLIFTTIKYNMSSELTKERKTAFIEYIVVSKNYQRKGIGTKLYEHLYNELKNKDIDSIELCVWEFNKEAVKFYESLGMNIKNMRFESTIS